MLPLDCRYYCCGRSNSRNGVFLIRSRRRQRQKPPHVSGKASVLLCERHERGFKESEALLRWLLLLLRWLLREWGLRRRKRRGFKALLLLLLEST